MHTSNRRKRPGVNAFSFLSSQDSSNNSVKEEEEEEESKTSLKDDEGDDDVNINPPSQNVLPILPTLERAIQLHYLTQNIRREFHGDSYGRQHTFAHSTVNDHRRRGTATFISTFLQLVKKTIYCTLMMIFIVLSSTLCYAILYNIIMPSNAFTREVFFDYCVPTSSSSNGRNIMYPKAEIDLMTTHTQWTAYVDDIFDPFVTKESFHNEMPRILEPRQSYYIHLALTLPESSINRNIGMFMVNMKLYHSPNFASRYRANHHLHDDDDDDEDKQISEQQDVLLATSFRPAMLPFQSAYVSAVKKSTIMIPLVIGAVPEARTIVVESFDHFLESFQYPFTKVEIELISTNQLKDDSNERPIQIHKAELRIGMELTWFQRILKEWFYTCAMVGCFMFAFAQVMGWSLVKLLYRIKIKAKRLRRSQLEDVLFDDDEEDISYLNLSETDLVQDEKIDEDDDSEQWDPIPQTGDENQSVEDVQQHAVVEDDDATQSVQDHPTPSQPHKKNKRRNRNKKKKSSTDHTTDGMQEVVHRVMQGDIGPYEIFTDLDEPS
jgi:hypothetical protein